MPPLSGQMPVEIDHAFMITAFGTDVSEDVPSTFRAGPAGPIGFGQGFGPTKVVFKFSQAKGTQPEFGTITDLKAKTHTITISPSSVARRLIVGCVLTSHSIVNDPEKGDTTWSLTFQGTESKEA